MNALAFGFEDQLVRVHDRGGAPWFVAQDVCSCLEIANHRDAVASLDDDEKGVVTTDTLGGPQSTAVVSESGVYVLIFRSRKPAAKRFRKWVTAEVLPTLRRTGSYSVPDAANDECPPLDGAAMDQERHTMLSLAVVREARQVWGRGQARRIWRQLGLPDGCDRLDKAMMAHRIEVAASDLTESIADWLHDCTRAEAGARTQSSALWDSYRAWCAERQIEPCSNARFGMTLHGLGYAPVKSGIMWRDGIVLK